MLKDKFKRISVGEATTPKDGEVITHAWWIVEDGCVLFFGKGGNPQCNKNKEIAEKIRDKMFPDASVQYFEVIFIGQERIHDETGESLLVGGCHE